MSIGTGIQQEKMIVENYFESTAYYWKQLYRDPGLKQAIFSYRQWVALRWIDELRLPPGASVLDVGCGAGLGSVALAKRGYRVHALDVVKAMLELTRQCGEEAGVSELITPTLGDVHHLDFPDNTFHAVSALGLIYWLHSPEQGLREMVRVLKPGGSLVVSADNLWRLTYILDPVHLPLVLALLRMGARLLRRLGWRKPASSFTVKRLAIWQFDQLLMHVGLQKVRGMTLGFGPFSCFDRKLFPESTGLRLHWWLQERAEQGWPILRTGGNHYVVSAQKPL